MCRVIAVANQKGGVGKTTTCVNLGIGLARAGKKVLLVEADAQGSMAVSLGIAEPDELDVTLVNIMEKVINDEDLEPGEGIIHHEEGIVRIDIIDQDNTIGILELEEAVKERFELKDILIVPSATGTCYDVAHEAARMVDGMMFDGIRISLTWGATLELLVDFLNGSNYIRDIEVYTLLGTQGTIGMQMQQNTIAQNLLRKYKGTGYVVNAPFMCESAETAQSIMRDNTFTAIVDRARESDLTLVGIGPTPNTAASISSMRYDLDTVRELKNHNVCGDICSNFYDIYGNLSKNPLCDRFVKVSLEEIKKHKNVVGIANGDHKVASILGALNGRYLDTLITDQSTMVSVVEMADRLGI